MPTRIGAFVVIPVVLFAGILALQKAERVPNATAPTSHEDSAPPAPAGEMLPVGNGEMLPPNHPPIGAAANGEMLPPNHPPIGAVGSPHGSLPPAAGDPPAVAWKMPATWQEAPNPNAMRLA